jgi:hypothetical protein
MFANDVERRGSNMPDVRTIRLHHLRRELPQRLGISPDAHEDPREARKLRHERNDP